MKNMSAIHPAITENMENMLVKRTPQILIIGKASTLRTQLRMFCLLHSNISKEQHKKHLCNPSSHCGKYGEYTHETCILIHESHNASISAMSNSFHNIVSKA